MAFALAGAVRTQRLISKWPMTGCGVFRRAGFAWAVGRRTQRRLPLALGCVGALGLGLGAGVPDGGDGGCRPSRNRAGKENS